MPPGRRRVPVHLSVTSAYCPPPPARPPLSPLCALAKCTWSARLPFFRSKSEDWHMSPFVHFRGRREFGRSPGRWPSICQVRLRKTNIIRSPLIISLKLVKLETSYSSFLRPFLPSLDVMSACCLLCKRNSDARIPLGQRTCREGLAKVNSSLLTILPAIWNCSYTNYH